ncbi:MAG: class I SAM-dependent methyltransferase [Planctomycetes bacterium]|nr:class I SAM-dependent methyltransferase [Planctomycetota bacterium]
MKKRAPRPQYTARTADKQILYQNSVQAPDAEVAFCRRIYKKRYGVEATLFREDFCGTFLISCDWVKRGPKNQAWGIDLDQPTLDWGRKHNLSKLKPALQKRVHILNQNVLDVTKPKMHIVGAFNFSYFIFKSPVELIAYFSKVRKSLAPKSIFVVDAYGGYDSQKVMQDTRKCEGFTYIWDQAEYNPLTDETLCHIHFHFPDGTRMRKAFTYDWRLWTLGGIRDAMKAAGFRETEAYWEGTMNNGEGDGIFRKAERAENCGAWTAYIVGIP